jgi:antitoxin component of RelBE/YafQ-DinJ toxin-antitoxin module
MIATSVRMPQETMKDVAEVARDLGITRNAAMNLLLRKGIQVARAEARRVEQ